MDSMERRLNELRAAGTYRVLPINEGPCEAVISFQGRPIINLTSIIILALLTTLV
jgi:hypothetical protein